MARFTKILPEDGKRPGTYYINLYNMKDQPIYQAEALAYHEGIPGHHMQIAIAQELKRCSEVRRHGGNVAYVEGWALYSELVPKEIPVLQRPVLRFRPFVQRGLPRCTARSRCRHSLQEMDAHTSV